MANLKWKDAETLTDSMYDTVLVQARDNLLLSFQAAGFFVIWIFPMLGYVGEASHGLGIFLKCMSVLFTGIALFIIGFQTFPYLKIRNGDFTWLYTKVESSDMHQIVCENGIACEDISTKYQAGTKVIVLQISGKPVLFSREIKRDKKSKKAKKKS